MLLPSRITLLCFSKCHSAYRLDLFKETRPSEETAPARKIVVAGGHWCLSPKKSTMAVCALARLILLGTEMSCALNIIRLGFGVFK